MPIGTVQRTMVCIWTLQIELDNGHDDDSGGWYSYQDSKERDKCFGGERHDHICYIEESLHVKWKFNYLIPSLGTLSLRRKGMVVSERAMQSCGEAKGYQWSMSVQHALRWVQERNNGWSLNQIERPDCAAKPPRSKPWRCPSTIIGHASSASAT